MEELEREIDTARASDDRYLLVVHGFGASGVGGAIKAELAAELPRLAKAYGFRVYSDKDRIPRHTDFDPPRLNPGSTLLIFPSKSKPDYRPTFRELRSRTKVRAGTSTSGKDAGGCRHPKRRLLSRGPTDDTFKCRLCGKTFVLPRRGAANQG
jgi:hypothetical protein